MFYPHESVRLVRDMPDGALKAGTEGRVEQVVRDTDGAVTAFEVRFFAESGTSVLQLGANDIEPVISRSTQDRSAVIWGVALAPDKLIETAMHAVLDRGFVMRSGLNVAQLLYDRQERWWKWGERFSDPAGAEAVVSGPGWDGGVVAFSGRQRYQLEFRLKGRGEACLLLHEREEAYREQARETPPAMSFARVLMNLYNAVGAQFCAFPVADPWLMDEDWRSLLRSPYYPDFFLLPEEAFPKDYPESFRIARLTDNRVMLTDLPIKFSPVDDNIARTEDELKADALRKCHSLGEKYYDQMYETHFNVNGLYSSVKDAFIDAISIAKQLGMQEEAGKLESRLDHIKAVFRSQFS